MEPDPGKYNEYYLDEIERKITLAAVNNIYVMLDMHQDLFSRKFSDGAPLWATLDEGLPHQPGETWSDAYLLSKAVQKSFDNFWLNKPAADGIGIQDHYISMWVHVAERFLGYSNIIGYDIMNEPFNGSGANEIMSLMLTEYARILAEETGQAPPSEHELMMIWADEHSRLELLKRLSEPSKYKRILDAAIEPDKQFETDLLQPFYQRITDSIRMIDTLHIIFLEHGYFSNPGLRTSIEPVKGKDGLADPLQAYAAHAYDLVVDTKEADQLNNERIEFIFNRIRETSERLNMPVLIGEWGAFYGLGETYIPSARYILDLIERFQFGNTYWAYRPNMEDAECFKEALLRPYPQYISGTLNSYGTDYETRVFTCAWTEDKSSKASTVIFVPGYFSLAEENIKFIPDNDNYKIQRIENRQAAYLVIPVTNRQGSRSVSIRFPEK
jgi:endoglycosylceramidase